MLKISNANCTVEELHSMFSRYGKIVVNCIRGYAIIKFDDEESAMRAMRCYHNYPLHNKRLVIRPYKGGPVDHDEPLDMEIEQLGQVTSTSAALTTIDRIHQQALNKIKDFKPKIDEIVKLNAEGIQTALRNSIESMLEENLTEQQHKTKIDDYCSMYDRDVTRTIDKLKSMLSKLVKRLATFDKTAINLEQPVEKIHSAILPFQGDSIRLLDVRKPFYDTANGGPVKKMIVVSDSNFIAGFGGANCCKYYRVDDFKPIFSTEINAPTALATYQKQDRHYCLVGDSSGRIGVIKTNTFEKQYDEFPMHKSIITDIKRYQQNRFVSCSVDSYVRCWKAEEEERMQGQFNIEIVKTDQLYGEGQVASMDVLNETEIVLGLSNFRTIVMPLVGNRLLSSSSQPFPVLKVAKENERQFWACMDTTIKLLDTRCLSDGIIYENFGQKIRAFTKISENIFGFGGDKLVGMGDRRTTKVSLWKDSEVHGDQVRDMISMGRHVFSCGIDGKIVKWRAI